MKLDSESKQKKQVVILYFSTLFGVLLGVFSSIVNTRFLDPSIYGDVRYVQNIISFVASLLLFGYFLSGSRLLAISKDESYSRRVRGAMVIILGIACSVLILVTSLCYFFHSNKPSVALLFIISLPVCTSPLLINYVNTTAQGDNHIIRVSLARLLPALIYVPLAYLTYKYTGASSTKMILIQWGASSLILASIIWTTNPSFRNLKPIFKELTDENKNYGIQLYIGSLVMVSTNYLAGLFIGYFNSDNSQVGFYTLALTVTSPLAMLPSIIGTTYFKQFVSQPRIPTKVLKVSVFMTFISCVLFIILIKPIVQFLYSEKYSIVGSYASFLAVGYCIHGLGDMINRYLGAHGQGKSIRNSSIANGLFKILGYSLLVYLWNANGAVITTIICDIIYFGVLVYYYFKFVKQNESSRL